MISPRLSSGGKDNMNLSISLTPCSGSRLLEQVRPQVAILDLSWWPQIAARSSSGIMSRMVSPSQGLMEITKWHQQKYIYQCDLNNTLTTQRQWRRHYHRSSLRCHPWRYSGTSPWTEWHTCEWPCAPTRGRPKSHREGRPKCPGSVLEYKYQWTSPRTADLYVVPFLFLWKLVIDSMWSFHCWQFNLG